MATGSRRLQASSSVVKRVTFSQPPVSTHCTALNDVGSGKGREKEKRKKKHHHLMKGKNLSKPLLKNVDETIPEAASTLTRGRPEPEEDLTKKTMPPLTRTSSVTSVSSSTLATTTPTATPTTTTNAMESGDDTTDDLDDGKACPDYFGVKSYLHNFYESVAVKNPSLYEELEGGSGGDYRYLIHPEKPRCRTVWWKIAVWTGVNLLVVGAVIILVGYLVPRHQVVIGQNDDLEVIDRSALRFNYNLDACKLVGLIVFCVGGTIVAIALLFPSFLYSYCDEDWSLQPEPFKVGVVSEEDLPPQSPTEKKIPATEQVARIQPVWGLEEATTNHVIHPIAVKQ